jgi:acylphosphatase
MPTSKTRAHVMISGRVQGVFYRSDTRDAALRIGVAGWVRNTRDGRVEAVFEGDRADVEEMVQWCRSGPPNARVENVATDYQEYRGEFESFSILN